MTELERKALELELSSRLDLDALMHIQRDLGGLKTEALSRFAEGGMGGETLLNSFLAHVNDARAYITRLILHERENLEQRHIAIARVDPEPNRDST